MTKPKQMQ
jgi:hypothetical protein